MVYCIGLTGSIASGKSTVALLFGQLGMPVFSADNIAKQITLEGTKTYEKIVSHFGSLIVTKEGLLDRKKLREVIFANPQERIWLENLLHPKIRQQLEQDVRSCVEAYCIVEIPLLKDKTLYPYINRVLLVTSSVELQVQRVISRDKSTEAQALAIIAAQPSIEERKILANDILENNADTHRLKEAVEQLHLQYTQLAIAQRALDKH